MFNLRLFSNKHIRKSFFLFYFCVMCLFIIIIRSVEMIESEKIIVPRTNQREYKQNILLNVQTPNTFIGLKESN